MYSLLVEVMKITVSRTGSKPGNEETEECRSLSVRGHLVYKSSSRTAGAIRTQKKKELGP